MKIIAIGGEPATGKSTLMKALIKEFGWNGIEHILEYHFEYTVLGLQKEVCLLGFYEESQTFGGTDRYPMDIQPRATKSLPELANLYKVMLFEGDRLFNIKFLDECRKYDLVTFFLEAPEDVKKMRHAKRDNQNEQWLRGRMTKLQNILKYNYATKNRYNIRRLASCDEGDIQENVKIILEELK